MQRGLVQKSLSNGLPVGAHIDGEGEIEGQGEIGGQLASSLTNDNQTNKEAVESISLSGLDSSEDLKKAKKWLLVATSKKPLSEVVASEKLLVWLQKKDLDESVIDDAIAWAKAQRVLDDEALAFAWVDNRGVKRGYGRRRLISELRKMKIAETIIDMAISQLGEIDEYNQALDLAKKRAERYSVKENPRKVAAKVAAFLLRRGFDSSLAHRAALEATKADEQWD